MLEASLTEMASRIDAYVKRIDENDKNVKGTIETKLQEMQAVTRKDITDAMTASNAQMETIKQEIGQRVMHIEAQSNRQMCRSRRRTLTT